MLSTLPAVNKMFVFNQSSQKACRSRTTTQQSPHLFRWDAPNLPPKLLLSFRRSPPPSNTPISQPTPLTTPNGIRIQSAVLLQYISAQTNTHRLTDGISDRLIPIALKLYSIASLEQRANNVRWRWPSFDLNGMKCSVPFTTDVLKISKCKKS